MELHHPNPAWILKCVILSWLVFSVQYSVALVSKAELPWELQDCYNSYANISLRDVVSHSICWSCEAPLIGRLLRKKARFLNTQSSAEYVQGLMEKLSEKLAESRVKRQATPKCRRREYRTLTDEERNRFHWAINVLKQDTSVWPNKYDALARLHSGPAIPSAHWGPNFLGWHRVYILLMEAALQKVDPTLCLPYWDSSLDSELPVPRLSYIFSPTFLGGNGPVRDGPFAKWVTPDFGPLIRNIGALGQLNNSTAIDNILSQTRMQDITHQNRFPSNEFEFNNHLVHVFIGGQMSRLHAAAHDPVFFLHHAFVDYLWEAFRTRQRVLGIDPQLDYPRNFPSTLHAPDRPIGFGMIMTAFEAYSDRLTDTYEYEPSPTCNRARPSCGSVYLQCNVGRARCVPVNPSTTTGSSIAISSSTSGAVPFSGSSVSPATYIGMSSSSSPMEIQNTFCIDGKCDTGLWVYIPVKASVRTPDLKMYYSNPVYNGTVWTSRDIYQLYENTEPYRYISRGAPKGYEKCHNGKGIGQIYIQSNGLSYDGFYQESVTIDQRLATSLAVGYVAVKDPKNGPVKTLLRAFDSCGRICRTSCKVPGTQNTEPCSGVFDIADIPGRPRQYSQTYGQATLDTWGNASNPDNPNFVDSDIVLTFYCGYGDKIPWVAERTTSSRTIKLQTIPVASLRPGPTGVVAECRVDKECIIDVSCEVIDDFCMGEGYKCRGTSNKYAVCTLGRLIKRQCPLNWKYDETTKQCNARRNVVPAKR